MFIYKVNILGEFYLETTSFGSTHSMNDFRKGPLREVYDKLKRAILEFDLKPGEKIREDVISRKLNCSRTPVREAIIRLEHDGLLEKIPHQGVFVKKFSMKEIMEIHTVQELLEIPTALLALENRTEDDLADLRANLDNCDRSLSEGDLTTYSIESLRFHQLLYEASKNVALTQILQNVREKLIIKSRINFLNMERIRLNLEDHRKIYECLVRQDRDKMDGLIRRHISEAHENFLRIIKDRPELLYVSI